GDAARHAIEDGDTVDLVVNGATVSCPAAVSEGQAEGMLAVNWGQGHFSPGVPIAQSVGTRFGGLAARPFARLLTGVELRKSATATPLRSTKPHTRLSGRTEELFQIAPPAEATQSRAETKPPPPSMLNVPS